MRVVVDDGFLGIQSDSLGPPRTLPSTAVIQERICPRLSLVNPRTFSKYTFEEIGVEKLLKTPMTWWSTRAPWTA